MRTIQPINEMPDGTCRTIKARIFAQMSACNILDFSDRGAFKTTGVIEYEEDSTDDTLPTRME